MQNAVHAMHCYVVKLDIQNKRARNVEITNNFIILYYQ